MKNNIPEEVLVKFFTGESSREEQEWLMQWKNESVDNHLLFREFELIWANSVKENVDLTIDVESDLDKVHQQLQDSPEKNKRTRSQSVRLFPNLYKIAAVIVIAAGLGITYYFMNTNVPTGYKEISTRADELREVILADGTQVSINASSTFYYPAIFDENTRKVYLKGEAYFEVAKNKHKPFVIEAEGATTTVLGTSFNVRAFSKEELVTVTVLEGKVAFAAAKGQVTLTAGEKGILDKNKESVSEERNSDPNYIAWKTRKLIFREVELKEVAKTLGNYYHATIKIEDEKLASRTFTSTFDDKTLQDVLEIIKLSLNIKVEKKDGIYMLKE